MTPLKETERRADKWRDRMGWEQTEIDALATLQPGVLDRIVREAIDPFYDHKLFARVESARWKWRRAAQAAIDAQLDHAQFGRIRKTAERELEKMRGKLEEISEMARAATADLNVDLPPVEIPGPEIDETQQGEPLLSSEWSWADQTKSLKARKSYIDGAGS